MDINKIIETSKRLQEDIEYIKEARSRGSWYVPPTYVRKIRDDPRAIAYLKSLGLKKWTRKAMKCWNLQTYCIEHIRYIRGFDEAYKDGFKGWECHHVMETKYPMHITQELLQELGIYWYIPTRYLVFLNVDVHRDKHKLNKMVTERYEKWMYDAYLCGFDRLTSSLNEFNSMMQWPDTEALF